MANLFKDRQSRKDGRKRPGRTSPRNITVASDHRGPVFDRLFSSNSSRFRGQRTRDKIVDHNTNFENDQWYERVGLAGIDCHIIASNLSSCHPYGGENYARFQTSLRLIEPSMEERAPDQPENTPLGPFHFLDLPKEIRLLVYECLTVRTRHDTLFKEYAYEIEGNVHKGRVCCTVVTKCVPGISILAACKMVSEEAWPILIPLLNFVNHQPLNILLDVRHAAETIASPASPLAAIVGYYAALRSQPTISYTDFLDEAMRSFDPKPPASDAQLLNNGYYQDYPFHLYPWIFRDPVFRNTVDKGARQLIASSSRNQSFFSSTCELQIGLTNNGGVSPAEMMDCTELLRSALRRWFGNTRVITVVRPVPHTCDTTQFTNAMTDFWPRAGRGNFARVVRGTPVSIKEWESSWAEGEKFVE